MSENFSTHMTKITKAQQWVKISVHTGMKLQKRNNEWKFQSLHDSNDKKRNKVRTPRKLGSAAHVMTEFTSFCDIKLHALQCNLPRDTIAFRWASFH